MAITSQIVCVLAVVLCCNGQSQTCCYPGQMEATIDLIIGLVNDEGKTNMLTGYDLFSLDTPGKRIYVDEHMKGGQKPVRTEILQLYNEGQQYVIINNSTCTKSKLPQWEKYGCIPDNATLTHEYRIGMTDVKARDYLWSIGELSHLMTVTSDKCAPVLEEVIGDQGNEKMQGTFKFEDVTPGIKDPSVFDVPEICKGAPMMKTDVRRRSLVSFFHH